VRRFNCRLRSCRDYIFFQVSNEWPILLAAVGVLFAAAAVLPSTLTIVLSIIAVAVGLGVLVYDLRQLRRRWSAYEFSSIAAPFPIAAIPPPSSYPSPAYLEIPNRGTALVSDVIDHTIATRGLPARVSGEPYRLPRSLKASAPYVLPICNHGRLVFNGKVVGMSGDPLPPVSSLTTPIKLHIARFFDCQCSNEMCALRITNRDTGEEFDPRRSLLANTDGHLTTLAESQLANAVGISTLAITIDHELVLVKQSSRNVASPLLLAPSGSGSLDRRDLGSSRGETLQDIVRRGMQRELCEETGIRPEEIRYTTVVGFARWLERGAKPEFFGVTQLSTTAEDMATRRRLASDEMRYSGGTLTIPIDIDGLGREMANGTELLNTPSLPERIREDGSLPLLLALRAVALWRVRYASVAPN
jgi:hypothetical protein